jgi:hypothetical protein
MIDFLPFSLVTAPGEAEFTNIETPDTWHLTPAFETCSHALAVLRFLSSQRGLTLSGSCEDRTF